MPPDILAELRGLQDDARPEPFEHMRAVVEAELGLTLEQAFEEFDEEPIAAASIGQVHRARLPGGQGVVVKVQRPDAERQIEADIQLLYQAARVASERIRRLQFIDLVETVDEFARTVRRELDYGIEARNAEVFRRNFAGDDTVCGAEDLLAPHDRASAHDGARRGHRPAPARPRPSGPPPTA